ncbi:MAG: DUF2971 domain-containing protein [bacterium]
MDNLKNRQLRFSKPSQFNDPFDCAITPILSEPSSTEWQRIYKDAREAISNKEEFDIVYSRDGNCNDVFKDHIRSLIKDYFDRRLNTTLNDRGVACFSETFDDILMWSHYTDGHRGFCLEFDTHYDPFHKANPVDYSDVLPTLNPVEFLKEEPSQPLMALVWTKSKHWSYEKEWRIFHMVGDQQYSIQAQSLTAIYFGCEISDVRKEIISTILAGSPTQLYQMQKVPGEFKVRRIEDS